MTAKASFPVLDMLHLGLMLAALGLAYYLPFELVLLSYAILGPLHYLTEISWLHERSYFMARRWLAWVLVACTVSLLVFKAHMAVMGMILALALAFSAAFSLFKSAGARILVIAIGLVVGFLVTRIKPLNVPLVILLPTVIHVSLFTFLFMLVGALRSKSRSQLLLVAIYVLSIIIILAWPPTASVRSPDFAALGPRYFGPIGEAFGQIFGQNAWPFDARLAGFLSFIYTYHYLNWFIKVRVIKWDEVPPDRLFMIAVLGIGAICIYFINYSAGFLVLISLSLLHVLPEFPLNVISIRQLGGMLRPLRRVVS